MRIELQLSRNGVVVGQAPLEAAVEVGRRRLEESEPPPPGRFWIAEENETAVPRRWFSLTRLADAEVRIDNLHKLYPLRLAGGETVAAGESLVIRVPASIRLQEGYCLNLCPRAEAKPSGAEPTESIRSLMPLAGVGSADEALEVSPLYLSLRPAAGERAAGERAAGERGAVDAVAAVALVRKALAVVTAAVGSDAFLEAAVRAAAEIAGLDRATIFARIPASGTGTDASDARSALGGQDSAASLLAPAPGPGPGNAETLPPVMVEDAGEWRVRVRYVAEQARSFAEPPVSARLLKRVCELRTTQIFDAASTELTQSLASFSSVVAAPIFDRAGNVAAVLYGDRRRGIGGGEVQISDLEATLVEVLAGAVAAGLVRQEEERSRAHLAEFFSPRVATFVSKHPERLKGRDAEVSVLFCDVRGFSGVTERLGPEKTIAWMNDVLTELSRCVVDTDGVLVDYVGDELLAMWGAPQRQPEHASLAVATAMEMFAAVDRLRARWSELVGASFDVGIGINSGPAMVGNVGSQLKFKYGVLGNTVNVGSRLQGATKYFGVRCLASATTIELAGQVGSARRIAETGVVGIHQPLQIFECVPEPDDTWRTLREEYQAALSDYEAGQHGAAVHRLGRLLQLYPNDRPSALLLARAAKQLTDPSPEFVSVWRLQEK